MTVSITMLVHNRLELTKKTLESLFLHTDYPFRLIVVDNASDQETTEFIKNYNWTNTGNVFFKGVDLHFSQENHGVSIGRNIGISIANQYQDPYICCIDNDIEFVPNWLSEAVSFLGVNPKFCIGINYEGTEYPIKSVNGKKCQYKAAGNIGGALNIFPRALHEKIGYFIMEYGLYSCDDSDLCYRARLVGYQMAYLPESGKHLGAGEEDTGEYREFKDKQHAEISIKFRKSCGEYINGKRPVRIDFDATKYLNAVV